MQEVRQPTSNELAQKRTVMAAERTFMAWARTSLSMISFGFSIYKFMEYAGKPGVGREMSTEGARNLGTALVVLGVAFLIISGIQHWQLLKRMSPNLKALNLRSWPLSLFLAVLMTILGLLALLNMLFGIGPF